MADIYEQALGETIGGANSAADDRAQGPRRQRGLEVRPHAAYDALQKIQRSMRTGFAVLGYPATSSPARSRDADDAGVREPPDGRDVVHPHVLEDRGNGTGKAPTLRVSSPSGTHPAGPETSSRNFAKFVVRPERA